MTDVYMLVQITVVSLPHTLFSVLSSFIPCVSVSYLRCWYLCVLAFIPTTHIFILRACLSVMYMRSCPSVHFPLLPQLSPKSRYPHALSFSNDITPCVLSFFITRRISCPRSSWQKQRQQKRQQTTENQFPLQENCQPCSCRQPPSVGHRNVGYVALEERSTSSWRPWCRFHRSTGSGSSCLCPRHFCRAALWG